MQGRKHYFVRITSPLPYPLGCPERRFLQALSSPRAEPSKTHLGSSLCVDPTHGGAFFILGMSSTANVNLPPQRGTASSPQWLLAQCLVQPLLVHPTQCHGGLHHSESHLFHLLISNSPARPSHRKQADASFEATGDLSTWPSPFGDLALASWQ